MKFINFERNGFFKLLTHEGILNLTQYKRTTNKFAALSTEPRRICVFVCIY